MLVVDDLRTFFFTEDGVVKAVNGLDLEVHRGEVFGLVGESGCGKSVTGLSILGLIDRPGRIVGGEIRFNGQTLRDLPESQMVRMRGSRISMVFQQPLTSINPVFPIGFQIAEVFRIHRKMDRKPGLAERGGAFETGRHPGRGAAGRRATPTRSRAVRLSE